MWSTTGNEQEESKKGLIECLKVLEGVLGDQSFFGGDSFGFLDLAIVTYYSWFYAYETCGNFSIEAECPKLIAWVKRCLQKESVAKSLPDSEKIYGFVLQLKKNIGME